MNITLIKISLTILITFIIWFSVGYIYRKFFKEKKQIHINFFKNFIQIIVLLLCVYQVGMEFDSFQNLSKTLLTSSSLLVVVLGFAFQTSLEDFIAGILISIFKPFNIDDRISLVNQNISGYIEDITIRHTVIRTFTNNRLIIPNSVMNKEVIENTHTISSVSSNYLDVTITYDSDLLLSKKIISDIIESHPLTIVDDDGIKVFIRELGLNGVGLRASITTEDIDQNFNTCSEIREEVFEKFKKNNIKFASQTIKLEERKETVH